MDDGLKQRLVGALVLTALAVIFLPSLFKQDDRVVVDTTRLIPPSPNVKPVVIPEPVRPQKIAPAPPPDQAFQPGEELSSSSAVAEASEPRDKTSQSSGEASQYSGEASQSSGKASEPPSLDAMGLPKAWTVQVASFVEPQRAKKLRDKLLAADYTAYLRVLKTDKNAVTRVFVGPHIDRQRALAIKKKVDKELSVNSLVLSFTP